MRIVIASLVLLLSSQVSGQGGTLALSGIGATTCSEFASNFDKLSGSYRDAYGRMAVSWAQGFISGLNYQGVILKQSTIADMKRVRFEHLPTTLLEQCRANPTKPIFETILDLYGVLPRATVPAR